MGRRELERPVQEGQDRVPADEGVFMLGELGDQEIVERALAGGRDRRVAGPFAGSVARDARHGPRYAPTEDRGIVTCSSTMGDEWRRGRRATRSAADAASRRRVVVSLSPRDDASTACSRRSQARRTASRASASVSAEGAMPSRRRRPRAGWWRGGSGGGAGRHGRRERGAVDGDVRVGAERAASSAS